jgi:2,5-diketo-D-gluconate reductase B
MRDIIYGTYPLAGVELDATVQIAVEAGYRCFDTAQIYGNEAALGSALEHAGLPRNDFKVTTKIAPPNYGGGRFLPSLQQSLKDLKLDQVDLLLLHFPPVAGELPEVLDELVRALDARLAHAVGIGNFPAALMREAAVISPATLTVDQVEFHPLINGSELLAVSAETGIRLQAYSPLARGAALKQPVLQAVALSHGRTTAQVTLRWLLQQGLTPVGQSSNPSNIFVNLASSGFVFSATEMQSIGDLASLNQRIINTDVIPWAPAWN